MTATLSKPTWNAEYETQLLDRLVAEYAPNLPIVDRSQTRPPQTPEEIANVGQYRVFGAAHDLFIVQAIAKAIGPIIDDLHWQLSLSRQLADDGAHALDSLLRAQELLGYDPVDEVNQLIQEQWEGLGDLPIRDWLGFAAFQLHYELHNVGTFLLNGKVGRIKDPQTSSYFAERVLPDEAVHRFAVIDWWKDRYDRASANEKAELASQFLEVDEEFQRRRSPILKKYYWQKAYLSAGIDYIPQVGAIYDAWRREVLAYLLDIPIDQLPKLVSVDD
ncbi:hypothetical protein [Calothrix sp. NIES-2098]|uniref:hypothetical protein n=1 Tax=Calothrix sp. NIES-2098 TaxID=1954171 RepID=UPI000B5EBA78|nr:hypothetical protein NIES2098_13670 [Calothrix sp. NIES-2098]